MRHSQTQRRLLLLLGSLTGCGLVVGLPAIAQTNTNPVKTQPAVPPAATTDQSASTLLQAASRQGQFTTLAKLVQTAELGNALQTQGGKFTIFAPTDAAFAELPADTLEKLQRPENRAMLRQILGYHVVPQELPANQLKTGNLDSLAGGLAVRVEGTSVIVNDASVTQPDIKASNGVIHGINKVLLPANMTTSAK